MIAQELEETLHKAFVDARSARHEFISEEHLLRALLDNVSAREVLEACGASTDELRAKLDAHIEKVAPVVPGTEEVDTQPTLGFQRIVQRAIMHVQSTSSGKKEVTGANTLLALFGEKESFALHCLTAQGIKRLDVVDFIALGTRVSDPSPPLRERTRSGEGNQLTVKIGQALEVTLQTAFVEARQLRHEFLTVEHLMLALLNNPSAADVLSACAANVDELRRSLSRFVEENTPLVQGTGEVDTQPTLGFQRVIQRAIIQVQAASGKELRGADVLLAMFGEKDSHAVYYLHQQAVTRLDVVNVMAEGRRKPTLSEPFPFEPREPRPTRKRRASRPVVDRVGSGDGAISQELEITLHKAFVEARQQRHEFITVEHVLLALLDNPTASDVLEACAANLDELRRQLTQFIRENTPVVGGTEEVDTQPTLSFQRIVQRAIMHVQGIGEGKRKVMSDDLLKAIFGEKDSHAVYYLHQQGVTRLDVVNYIAHGIAKVDFVDGFDEPEGPRDAERDPAPDWSDLVPPPKAERWGAAGAPEFPTDWPPQWACAFGDDAFGLWAEFDVYGVVQRMRWVEPASFRMGAADGEAGAADHERPAHWVRISRGYWLAETACTWQLWDSVRLHTKPSRAPKGANHPVEKVSWDDVQVFLGQLAVILGGDAEPVLPSEAEWELACRAGETTAFALGTEVTTRQVRAGHAAASKGKRTVAVKSLRANRWGFYEMHGNVLEWCADDARDYPDQSAISGSLDDPRGMADAQSDVAGRVARGGSWALPLMQARSAARQVFPRSTRNDQIGFRFALQR